MTWKLAELRSTTDWGMAYRRCGLPAREREGFVEVLTDEWTSALILPERLARNVFEASPTRGPVLVRRRHRQLPGRWRFFTWLDQIPSAQALADIGRAGAFLPGHGTPILLPTGAEHNTIEGRWARWPEKDLPSLSDLMSTTRAVMADPRIDHLG